MKNFCFIAHRGASADATDNSVDAFDLAIKQGADMIETDVQITQDGVIVLEHDFEVDGQLVVNLRLDELRQIKPHILTLASALNKYGKLIPFCWELKMPGLEAGLVNMVKDITSEEIWEKTNFSSFFWGSALKIKNFAPDKKVGWLTKEWNEKAIDKVKDAGLDQICPMAKSIIEKPELVKKANSLGVDVRAWLVESPEMLPLLISVGVSGATVDWPAVAKKHCST